MMIILITVMDNLKQYKMNDVMNKFLLEVDKFMSKTYLKQPGFT